MCTTKGKTVGPCTGSPVHFELILIAPLRSGSTAPLKIKKNGWSQASSSPLDSASRSPNESGDEDLYEDSTLALEQSKSNHTNTGRSLVGQTDAASNDAGSKGGGLQTRESHHTAKATRSEVIERTATPKAQAGSAGESSYEGDAVPRAKRPNSASSDLYDYPYEDRAGDAHRKGAPSEHDEPPVNAETRHIGQKINMSHARPEIADPKSEASMSRPNISGKPESGQDHGDSMKRDLENMERSAGDSDSQAKADRPPSSQFRLVDYSSKAYFVWGSAVCGLLFRRQHGPQTGGA